MKNQVIYIVLTTSVDQIISFEAGFDAAGGFYTTDPEVDGHEGWGHTENAFISHIDTDLNGDAWRDIEAGGYLEEFLRKVVFGSCDAQDFLVNVSNVLGSQPAGQAY